MVFAQSQAPRAASPTLPGHSCLPSSRQWGWSLGTRNVGAFLIFCNCERCFRWKPSHTTLSISICNYRLPPPPIWSPPGLPFDHPAGSKSEGWSSILPSFALTKLQLGPGLNRVAHPPQNLHQRPGVQHIRRNQRGGKICKIWPKTGAVWGKIDLASLDHRPWPRISKVMFYNHFNLQLYSNTEPQGILSGGGWTDSPDSRSL